MSPFRMAPARSVSEPGTITYPGGVVPFGPGYPTLCINDQMGYWCERPEVFAALQAGRLEHLIDLARRGFAVGMPCINVQLMQHTLNQIELVPRVVRTLLHEVGCAISIDTRDPLVLEAGLQACRPYKAFCNVISGEWDNLNTLLPIIARYGGAIGTALVYEKGVPQSIDERLTVARRIVETAESYGIPRQDIAIDCLCLPSSVVPDTMRVALYTIQAVHNELGVPTLLGISNAGAMMPAPELLDLAYLMAAVAYGLDVAMTNPETPMIDGLVYAMDFLMGTDLHGKRYLNWYRQWSKEGEPRKHEPLSYSATSVGAWPPRNPHVD